MFKTFLKTAALAALCSIGAGASAATLGLTTAAPTLTGTGDVVAAGTILVSQNWVRDGAPSGSAEVFDFIYDSAAPAPRSLIYAEDMALLQFAEDYAITDYGFTQTSLEFRLVLQGAPASNPDVLLTLVSNDTQAFDFTDASGALLDPFTDEQTLFTSLQGFGASKIKFSLANIVPADPGIAPVPLPAGGVLLLTAVAGIAALRRKSA